MDIDARVGLACDARAHGVDDAEDASALLLGQFDGGQRVGGLTTLRDGYHHIGGIDHRVAIAELRRVVDLHRNLAVVLNELLAYEASVPRRSTRHDDESRG